ncbi:MAG TPA: NUDIX domain-containing protein [Candidatus Paceibacterota bacterium]|jgi:NAD+ diphosphatase
MKEALYSIAVTAIIERDGQYLIAKRPSTSTRWPGRWTVPGGRLEPADYESLPKDTEQEWYSILEKVAQREVLEEVGIVIKDIKYLTSIIVHYNTTVPPTLIISFYARHASGEVAVDPLEVDEAIWVTLEQAKSHDLIGDIYGELVMANEHLHNGTPA